MSVDDRLKSIAEKQLPFPEKCCAVTRSELTSLRKMRVRKMRDQLFGLTPEQVEEKVKEWEQ